MVLQHIVNIAEICARKAVSNIVLSPGSRCAPLTLAFVRHPAIDTKTISDERSAAFIALGIAQQVKHPVGLVCTSGSAAYNYAPAVAEAFFQHVPLIVFTADRPPEWVDQYDGQTIRQNEIYAKHVKASYQLPVDTGHADAKWQAERIISEAINLSETFPEGPVHINVPLREPLYPSPGEKWLADPGVKIINRQAATLTLTGAQWSKLAAQWEGLNKKLIVGGQHPWDKHLLAALEDFSNRQQTPVLADIITNLHGLENAITHQDTFLAAVKEAEKTALQPDLLVTFGRSVISKQLKQFLRKFRPKAHWHIQPAGEVADSFQSLTQIIALSPETFFTGLKALVSPVPAQQKYARLWEAENSRVTSFHKALFRQEQFGEFEALKIVLENLPPKSNLHLANSMVVRYANFIGLKPGQKDIRVYANRGTSGIDGSNSTATGSALSNSRLNLLLTGDMAFFYDRNAFWHNYRLPNLKIIIFNNHAGGIFRLIDGPARQPELDEYFETRQRLNAANTAKDYNMEYLFCDSFEKLNESLNVLFKTSTHAKILEIETRSKVNQQIYNQYKIITNKHDEV